MRVGILHRPLHRGYPCSSQSAASVITNALPIPSPRASERTYRSSRWMPWRPVHVEVVRYQSAIPYRCPGVGPSTTRQNAAGRPDGVRARSPIDSGNSSRARSSSEVSTWSGYLRCAPTHGSSRVSVAHQRPWPLEPRHPRSRRRSSWYEPTGRGSRRMHERTYGHWQPANPHPYGLALLAFGTSIRVAQRQSIRLLIGRLLVRIQSRALNQYL